MGSQKQKPINKRLTKFLLHYPTVFFSKDVVIDVQKLTTSELINFEAEIIDNIILFAKKIIYVNLKQETTEKSLDIKFVFAAVHFLISNYTSL